MRSEIKYLVSEDRISRLRDAVAPFVYPDPHGKGYEGVGYTVRSLYLDTPSLSCYHEKKAGLRVRRKLRIRGYNYRDVDDPVFLEIKRKIGDRISKTRAATDFNQLAALFDTGDVHRYSFSDPAYPRAAHDAGRFLYHVYRYGLIPTFTTVYEREAFHGLHDSTFRITFDRNLRGRSYSKLRDLYSDERLRYVSPEHFIIEVKYNTRYPAWLRSVLEGFGLRRQALSKYCLCAEALQRQHDRKGSVLSAAYRIS